MKPPIVAKGELVPQITLNALADPNEEWTLFEVGEIMYRQFNQWLNLDLEHSGVSSPNYQILANFLTPLNHLKSIQ